MPVAILGMHRSGTSMVARLLNLCGLTLGDEAAMVPATDDNRRGHWEHRELVRMNARVLAHFGGAAEDPPVLPAGWAEQPELQPLRAEAHQLVRDLFGPRDDWGWKDPRTALTLPFWRPITGEMRCVVCIRNPLDSAASLATRNNVPLRKALALWQYYTESALRNTRPHERIVVFYEDFFADYRAALAPALAFLGLPPLEPGSARDAAVAENVDADLKHHSHSLDDVLASPDAFTVTRLLYAGLLHAPELVDAALAHPAVEEHTLRSWGDDAAAVAAEQSAYIAQRAREVATLREWTGKQQADIEWHAEQRDVLLAELERVRSWATDQERIIAEQAARQRTLDGELDELRMWAAEQRQTIAWQAAELEKAHAWAGEQQDVIAAQIETAARLERELAELRDWTAQQRTTIDQQTARLTQLERDVSAPNGAPARHR